MSERVTPHQRGIHRVLAGTFATALILAVSACSPAEEDQQEDQPIPRHDFVSRPDLAAPQASISQGEAWTSAYEDADEYIFLTPNYGTDTPSDGAVIFDSRGGAGLDESFRGG